MSSLDDLHNPNNINGFLHINGTFIYANESKNQRFQEYPGSIELWQLLDDGRLVRLQRWLKKSTLFFFQGDLS